jgi:alkaline phosphatase D
VSDLVWLDEKAYDPATGSGSIGVEFAGSAVTSPCPAGANISIADADEYTSWLVANNPELQWNDLYYRGYYELHVSHDSVQAQYFGMPTIVSRNPFEISLANFTVRNGENKLARPVGGGVVESGTLKGGTSKHTNLSTSSFAMN